MLGGRGNGLDGVYSAVWVTVVYNIMVVIRLARRLGR